MPFEISLENNGERVVTRYFGLLTTDDIREAYEKRFTDPDMVKKYRLIVSDYSDVTETSLDDVDVEVLAEIYKRASRYNPNVVAVTIMPDIFLYGMGRMWEAYVDGIPWKERVVQSKEEAYAFIEECLEE